MGWGTWMKFGDSGGMALRLDGFGGAVEVEECRACHWRQRLHSDDDGGDGRGGMVPLS